MSLSIEPTHTGSQGRREENIQRALSDGCRTQEDAYEKRTSMNAERSSQTLQNLPPELRYGIYESLLPQQQRIDLIRTSKRSLTLGPLGRTCKQINEEIRQWYKIPQISKRFVKTVRWGIIDIETAVFLVDIDQAFTNHYWPCFRRVCSRCNFIDQPIDDHEDYSYIRHVVLHFKTKDGPNNTMLEKVWRFPNLDGVEILIGDVGKGWGMSREQLQQFETLIRSYYSEKWYCVPVDRGVIAKIARNLHDDVESRAQTPILSEPVVKIWDMWPEEDPFGGKKLLISYNDEMDCNFIGV